MTDQEMQSSILSALGWVPEFVPSNKEIAAAKDGTGQYEGAAGYPIGSGPLGGMQATWWKNPKGEFETPPDYPKDLNAMREAVANLKPDDANRWAEELDKITAFGANPHWTNRYHLANATARQRAEAFLKVIGKWKD